MAFSIGGGKNKNKTSGSQNNTIDDWSKGWFENTAGQIGNLLGQPAQAYGGQLTAGPNALQTQAGEAAKGLLDYKPTHVSANSFADADLSKYMNPQTQGVIDAALGDIERSRQMQQVNDAQGATAAGAWGGSRHGVANALTNEAAQRTSANTASTLRSQAYDKASDLWARDEANRMAAAGMNGQADLAAAQFGANAASLLGQLGGQQQQAEQAGLDRNYADFLRLYEDPLKRAGLFQGLLSAIPTIVDTKTSGKSSGSNIGFGVGF